MLVSKAVRAITNIPKARSSESVMYICITSPPNEGEPSTVIMVSLKLIITASVLNFKKFSYM